MNFCVAQFDSEYAFEGVYGPFPTLEEAGEAARKLAVAQMDELKPMFEKPLRVHQDSSGSCFVECKDPEHEYAEGGVWNVVYYETYQMKGVD